MGGGASLARARREARDGMPPVPPRSERRVHSMALPGTPRAAGVRPCTFFAPFTSRRANRGGTPRGQGGTVGEEAPCTHGVVP